MTGLSKEFPRSGHLGFPEQIVLCLTVLLIYFGNLFFLTNFTRYAANAYFRWKGEANIPDQVVTQFLFEAVYWSPVMAMLVFGLLSQALTHLLWLLVVEKNRKNLSSEFCRTLLYRGFLMIGFFILLNIIFLMSLDDMRHDRMRENLLESLFSPRSEAARELYSSMPQNTDTAWLAWLFWLALIISALFAWFKKITPELIGCLVFALPLAFAPQILHRASTLEVLGLIHSHNYGVLLVGLSSVLLCLPTVVFLIGRLYKANREHREGAC